MKDGSQTDWTGRKATQDALEKFTTSFGRSMGFEPVCASELPRVEVIPTGSLALDCALKTGGYPLGRVIQTWGANAAGKTSLAMMAVASAQRAYPDKVAAWVDMEATFDPRWASELGVELDNLLLVPNPHDAEDAADACRRFVRSGLCSIVVLDSVGSMVSREEQEKNADEDVVARVARIVTRMVKEVTAVGRSNQTTTMVVNQVRSNIAKYGPTTTKPGGHLLQHAASVTLAVRRGASEPHTVRVDGQDVPVSYEMSVKVEKNKCAPAGSTALVWLTNQATQQYGPVGVDLPDEAATFGDKLGLVERRGAWYATSDGVRHNGREKLVAHLRGHPGLVADIRLRAIASLARELRDDEVEADDPYGIADVM